MERWARLDVVGGSSRQWQCPVPWHHAAILAADVAGYLRLMGEDEVGRFATVSADPTELIELKFRARWSRRRGTGYSPSSPAWWMPSRLRGAWRNGAAVQIVARCSP